MGEVSTGVTISGRRNASAPTSRRFRRRRRVPCARLRPIASGPSPGSGRPRGRDVRVPEKKKTRLRAVAYPRRGEFCPENGGEGAPQMGDLRVESTLIGSAMRSDEVLESEKIDGGELLDGASCGQPGACRVNASGRSSRISAG